MVDAPEAAPDGPANADHDLAGRALVVCYSDAAGQQSERRIICHEVYAAGGHVYLRCRCLERQASRTFRVDRVSAVYCGVTGEDLGAPGRLLLPSAVRSERPRPPHRDRIIRHALRVLMTVARCDGRVALAEADTVHAFLRSVVEPSRPRADAHSLYDYAYRLAPNFESMLDSFATVVEEDREIALTLLEAAIEVAGAHDGFCDNEVEVLEELVSVARAYGMKVVLEPYEIS